MDSPDLKKTSQIKPDVLRVVEYVLAKSSMKESFSVKEAARTDELNGIRDYRIAEILREVCLQPNGPDSIDQLTNHENHMWSSAGSWTLSSSAYFGYLSYQSNLNAEKANQNAKWALWIAVFTLILTAINQLPSCIS